MEETSRFASEFANVTTLGAGSISALVISTLAIFALPRRYVLLPVILATSFVPVSQRLVIAGLDFDFLRLTMVIAWVRLVSRGEIKPFRWNHIDSLFTAWILWLVLAVTIRTASMGALINQLGHTLNAFGIYFLVRVLIRDWKDLDRLVLCFVIASIPVALSMLYEATTGWNPASIVGQGIGIAVERDDRIRAMCGYTHPLIAGCFWASMISLIAARLWQRGASRALTAAGLVAALTCVITSASSTPLLGVGFVAIAGATWVMRYRMNLVRWGILGIVVFLEIAMEKPIWHLFQRVSALGLDSSTGYHRYRLFDSFVKHFADWAPIGLNSTAYWGKQMDDVTNVFIVQAVRGGLVALLLVLALFVAMYQRNGTVVQSLRRHRALQIYAWGLGVSLFAHTVMMTATGYISQILLPWYTCFALIASVRPLRRRVPPRSNGAEKIGESEGSAETLAGPSASAGNARSPTRASPRGALRALAASVLTIR